jgi:hypothetical protein
VFEDGEYTYYGCDTNGVDDYDETETAAKVPVSALWSPWSNGGDELDFEEEEFFFP